MALSSIYRTILHLETTTPSRMVARESGSMTAPRATHWMETRSSAIATTSAAPPISAAASCWMTPAATPFATTTCGRTELSTASTIPTGYALTRLPRGTQFKAITSETTSRTTAMTRPQATAGPTTMEGLPSPPRQRSATPIRKTPSWSRPVGIRATRGTASTMGWPPTTTGRVSIRQSTLRSRTCWTCCPRSASGASVGRVLSSTPFARRDRRGPAVAGPLVSASRSPLCVCASSLGRFCDLLPCRLKAFPDHLPPHLLLPEYRPERLEAPPHRPLPIAEVLERREQQQPAQIAEPAIPLETHLLEHHGPERQQHPVTPRHEHEEQREVGIHGTDQQAAHGDHVPEHFDERGEHLTEREERHRDQSHATVAGVEEHPFVLPHRRDQAALPALPLA